MSDHWLIRPEIPIKKFEAVVSKFNWTIGTNKDGEGRWVHDGTSYFHIDEYNNKVGGFWRYGMQDTLLDMVDKLEGEFDSEFVIEHDDRYWEIIDEDQEGSND